MELAQRQYTREEIEKMEREAKKKLKELKKPPKGIIGKIVHSHH